MSFDRNQPFEEVAEPPVQGFDKSKPFEETGANFDPAAVLIDPRRAHQHATEDGKAAISMLMDSQPDEESKARSVNQVYLKPRVSYLPQRVMMENWPAVRDGYAKSLGYTQGSVSEQQFTELLRKEAETNKKALWADAVANKDIMGALKLAFGDHGISDPDLKVEHAVPMIGSEAAGTKGGAFTVPKMEGTGTLVGLINAANKFTASMTTPENAGIALVTGGAGVVADLAPLTRAAVISRATQAATLGTFTAIGAKDTVNAVAEAKIKMNDPKATDAEKAEALATVVFSAAMTAAAAKGTYDFAGEAKAAGAGEKETVNPAAQRADSINLLRAEAEKADAATAKTLNQVADEIQALPPVVEKAEPTKPGEATVEDLDGGGFSVTDKDGNRVYTQDRETADALAKDLGAKAETKGNDRAEYDQLQKEMADMGYDKAGTPAFNELWQKSEDIKNRNEGMPPEEKAAETPVKEPDLLEQAKTPEAVQESVKTAKEAVVGIKNASVDEALAKMGMEPATHGEKLSFEEARQDAAKKMEKDPLAGQKLIAQLEAEPRPVTGKENALLLHELTRLTNERAAAERDFIEATNMGDPQAIAEAKVRVQQATTDYAKAADIDTKVGTANAIGLSLRRMMMKEDYSLASMERRRMVANDGKPLTEAQKAEVVELHKDIAAKEAAMTEAKQRKAPQKEKGVVLKFINEQANEARKRIKERLTGQRTSGSALGADILADYAIIGAEYTAKGVVKFAEWSEAMIKELGEEIKPHLKSIFEKAVTVAEESKIAAELSAKKDRVQKEIERLSEKIKGGGETPEAKGAKRPSIKEVEELEQRRDELKQELSAMQKTATTIEDLKAAIKEKTAKIEAGDVTPEGQNNIRPSRQEIEVLRQERDALNEQIAEMRKKPAATPEETRLRQVESQIAELERQIESGEVFPKGKKPSVTSPEIKAAEAKLESLAFERDNLRETLQPHDIVVKEPKTAQEKRLSAFKGQRKRALEDLNRRIKEGDFEKKAKPEELHLDEEANRLQAEHDLAKLEYDRLLERDKYEKSSLGAKGLRVGTDVWDALRTIKATGELSFILRQGGMAAASHPIMSAKAVPNMMRALMEDPAGAHALNLQVLNHPRISEAIRDGVHIMDEHSSLNKKEEGFASRLVGKIPGIARLDRATTVYLNRIRFDLWQSMKSEGMTPMEGKAVANFVNISTGRGKLGMAEPAAVMLGRGLFSPRFWASRVQLLVGEPLWGGTKQTRKAIGKEYARALVSAAAFYTAVSLYKEYFADDPNKVKIGTDPDTSDFGKVVIGNAHIDPLAGVVQNAVFGTRTAQAAYYAAEHAIDPHASQPKRPDWSATLGRYVQGKLHPSFGLLIDSLNQKDLVGNPVTVPHDLKTAATSIAPMTYGDIAQVYHDQDIPEATAISLLALLGMGVNVYDKNAKKGGNVPPSRK